MRLAHRQLKLRGSALAVAALAAVAGGDPSASAAGTAARSDGHWIVLESNRDGATRGYSMRADGSRLTPLRTPRSPLVPVALSADGGTIAYADRRYDHPSGIYVSRADGAGLHRVVAGHASNPALSRDGRVLAFAKTKPGIWIVGADGRGARRLTRGRDGSPDWSPDGKAIVFFRRIGEFAGAVVVLPLHGTRRVLAWSQWDAEPRWSPDGSWIAYRNERQLWLVRPNGGQRHRVARQAGAFAWSPAGGRLAFTVQGEVAVVGVDGRGRRLHPSGLYVETVSWSPDGRRLALTGGYPSEIWLMGVDGRRLRRVTSEGSNDLVGWTRLAPVLPPARPIPRTERVVGASTVATRAPIVDLAADGSRVAFIVRSTATDCHHVAVWTPATKSIRRFSGLPSPCLDTDAIGPVALAGTRVAWLRTSGTGNSVETNMVTATLARPAPAWIAEAAASRGNDVGMFVRRPVGDGALLAVGVERSCDSDNNTGPGDPDQCPPGRRTGDIVAATVYRIEGPGPCHVIYSGPTRGCSSLAKADGTLSVLAVDAGRIAVRPDTGVRLLTSAGRVIRDFAVAADAAALSGNRLAVRTADAVEVYDTDSGRMAARFPAAKGLRLEDLEGDILVTGSGGTVTLRRLGDGRTTTIQAGGAARAQLEQPGLFVAGARRLTFTPMRDVLRRLGG